MSKEIEIARLMNVKIDKTTGRIYIEMEVTDPTWKQKILRVHNLPSVRLIIDEEDEV